jgi:hypothetical protein
MSDSDNGGETNTVRLSFRTTPTNLKKLVEIAKAEGWLNAHGKPNMSKVLNHVIERFSAPKARKRRKRSG